MKGIQSNLSGGRNRRYAGREDQSSSQSVRMLAGRLIIIRSLKPFWILLSMG